MDKKSEGSSCDCIGGPMGREHLKLIERVDSSFKQDYDRSSDRRKSAPTSESMRAKVVAASNGHSSSTTEVR